MVTDEISIGFRVIGQLCSQIGFEQISETSLELLSDVFERYLISLAKNIYILTTIGKVFVIMQNMFLLIIVNFYRFDFFNYSHFL